MPELKWDPLDFLECLAVEPSVEEYETEYSYEVIDEPLRLLISVWPLESVIDLGLYRADSEDPVIQHALYVRGSITLGKDRIGGYLKMTNVLSVPNRFAYLRAKEDLHDPDQVPFNFMFRLRTQPHIRLEYVYE